MQAAGPIASDILRTVLPVLTLLLGFGLSQWVQERERKRRLRGAWAALLVELQSCRESVQNFLAHGVAAPLGRLPGSAYAAHFAVVVADGRLSVHDIDVFGRAYSFVSEINRGYDAAAQAATAHDAKELEAQYRRNLIKATALLGENDGAPSLIDKAITVAEREMRRY